MRGVTLSELSEPAGRVMLYTCVMRVAGGLLVLTLAASACGSAERLAPAAQYESAVSLYERWAGTTAQRQAAEVLVAYGQNGRFTECVVARGFPDRVWQDSIHLVSRVDPLLATPWGAGRAPVDFSARQVAAARGLRFEYWANHPDSALHGVDDLTLAVGPSLLVQLAWYF